MQEVRSLTLPDVWMLDRFIARHPPADLLVASYLGYESPATKTDKAGEPKLSKRQAAKANRQALAAIQKVPGMFPASGPQPMPRFLRDMPEMHDLIGKMKSEVA